MKWLLNYYRGDLLSLELHLELNIQKIQIDNRIEDIPTREIMALLQTATLACVPSGFVLARVRVRVLVKRKSVYFR
jgi:hypothetical protein